MGFPGRAAIVTGAAQGLGLACAEALAPVVYLNLLLAVLLSLGRYSVPVLPCLLVLSAAGLDWLLERWRRPAPLSAT